MAVARYPAPLVLGDMLPTMRARFPVMVTVSLALAAAVLAAAGCGGGGKPEYCSNVSDLQQSVDDLKNVQLKSGALSTLADGCPVGAKRRKRGRELGEAGFPQPDQRAAVIRLEPFHRDQEASLVPDAPAAGSRSCRRSTAP